MIRIKQLNWTDANYIWEPIYLEWHWIILGSLSIIFSRSLVFKGLVFDATRDWVRGIRILHRLLLLGKDLRLNGSLKQRPDEASVDL